MRSVNWGRVILGGIVAGIVVNASETLLNAVVLRRQNEEAMRSLGKTVPMGGSAMAVWILWGLLFGIAAVWLYAAIRTRYGPGAGTAVKAGIAAWFFSHLLGTIAQVNMGLWPARTVAVPLIWTLVESVVATLVGAWLYKEEGAATTPAMARG